MKLTPQEVNRLFRECTVSSSSKDVQEEIITANGIFHRARFSKSKIEQNKSSILTLFNELPDGFRKENGDGMSFLNMCVDRYGNYWTSNHTTMELLVLLGIAIDAIEFNVPTQLWPMLPGNVPNIIIK